MASEWPPTMRISVEVRDRSLLELLFVRSAWGLLKGEPELAPSPDPGVSARPVEVDVPMWESRWQEAWDLVWEARLAARRGAPMYLDHTVRSWIEQYGEGGIDTFAMGKWIDQFIPELDAPLETHPERRNVAALKGAWESGLETIIVLPYRAPYAERVSRHHLVVSASVRNDPDRYADALRLLPN